MAWTAATVNAISRELKDCLQDAGVPECVAIFLIGRNIKKLEAFADLADTKAEIVDVVGGPAGLDVTDNIATQPLKSAWRNADAAVAAALAARKKGEEMDANYTLTPEKRQRIDDAVDAHNKFRWPASLCPSWPMISTCAP